MCYQFHVGLHVSRDAADESQVRQGEGGLRAAERATIVEPGDDQNQRRDQPEDR
jgi:hypothetical protein